MNDDDSAPRGGGVVQIEAPDPPVIIDPAQPDQRVVAETVAPVILLPHVVVDAEAEPLLRIEPRLRARRIEARRTARRHRRRIFITIGTVVVLVGTLAGLLYSPVLDVDRIEVAGAHHLSEAQVVAASGIGIGERLYDLDLDIARRRIARLPWIRRVRVERRWPDGVRIRVSERKPLVAVATEGGQRLVVATGGVVVGPAKGFEAGLALVGIEGFSPRVGARLDPDQARSAEVVSALPQVVTAAMADATISAEGELTVKLTSSGEVWFGRPEDLSWKLSTVESLLGGKVVLGCLGRMDLRIATAPVISRTC